MCIVQLMERMEVAGDYITNSFEYPLLSLTSTLCCIHSEHIDVAISVVHECSDQCIFVTSDFSRTVEREQVVHSALTFQHDYTSLLYCMNVYCMNQ